MSRIFIPDSAKAETTFLLIDALLGHLPRTCKARPARMTNPEWRMTKLQRLQVEAPTGHSIGQLHQKQPSQLISAALNSSFGIPSLVIPRSGPVTAIAEVSGVDEPTTRRALKLLTNRSIVVPQEGEEKYALVPMVAEFSRPEQAEVAMHNSRFIGVVGFVLAN